MTLSIIRPIRLDPYLDDTVKRKAKEMEITQSALLRMLIKLGLKELDNGKDRTL